MTQRRMRFLTSKTLGIIGSLGLAIIFAFSSAQARKKPRSAPDQMGSSVVATIDAAMVKPPVDQEVCFSPVESCDVKLVKFVDSATTSIDVAVFDVTLDEFVHHLLVKSKSVPVRIVVDRRQAKGQHSLVRTLLKGGANVRLGRQRGVMHNKFTIIDGKMIETGSFNYTNNATSANNENQVYLANPTIVQRYKKRFDEIWSEAQPISLESFANVKEHP